jgi:hypothetical protein
MSKFDEFEKSRNHLIRWNNFILCLFQLFSNMHVRHFTHISGHGCQYAFTVSSSGPLYRQRSIRSAFRWPMTCSTLGRCLSPRLNRLSCLSQWDCFPFFGMVRQGGYNSWRCWHVIYTLAVAGFGSPLLRWLRLWTPEAFCLQPSLRWINFFVDTIK